MGGVSRHHRGILVKPTTTADPPGSVLSLCSSRLFSSRFPSWEYIIEARIGACATTIVCRFYCIFAGLNTATATAVEPWETAGAAGGVGLIRTHFYIVLLSYLFPSIRALVDDDAMPGRVVVEQAKDDDDDHDTDDDAERG